MTTDRRRRRLLAVAVVIGVVGVGIAVPAVLAADRADPAPAAPDLRTLITCPATQVVTIDAATSSSDARTPDEAIDQLIVYVGHPDLRTTARRDTVYSTPTARTITITPAEAGDPIAAFAFETGPAGRLALSSWAMCWGFEP